jgi:hypothetical protein
VGIIAFIVSRKHGVNQSPMMLTRYEKRAIFQSLFSGQELALDKNGLALAGIEWWVR